MPHPPAPRDSLTPEQPFPGGEALSGLRAREGLRLNWLEGPRWDDPSPDSCMTALWPSFAIDRPQTWPTTTWSRESEGPDFDADKRLAWPQTYSGGHLLGKNGERPLGRWAIMYVTLLLLVGGAKIPTTVSLEQEPIAPKGCCLGEVPLKWGSLGRGRPVAAQPFLWEEACSYLLFALPHETPPQGNLQSLW